ncbi:MAG: glycine cleavage system aminomethyltransferase GcvT [Candidatus Methanosuratincola petrocarbonis]|nr:glycine cleavage system aminomethyltransferase GcvT [Candidatus Methanosuratincola sp.]
MGKRTPLYSAHAKAAHMGEFAGFELPIWYEGIVQEVLNTRRDASIFDVSHMGRFLIEGPESASLLDWVTTARISDLGLRQGKYSLLCNEWGGVLEDAIVFRVGEESFILVGNASRREFDLEWLISRGSRFEASVKDLSDSSLMLALQGPKAQERLQRVCSEDLSKIRRFRGEWARILGEEAFLTRTGYTGEDGFEATFFCLEGAERIWEGLLGVGFKPAGLGARDVLRIEAGLPLYSKELNESVTPIDAGLFFAVSMEKGEFIGKGALGEALREGGRRKFLVGIRMEEGGVPREGYPLFLDGERIGEVTSGTFSPSLGAGIGLGYISKQLEPERAVSVGVRGVLKACRIARIPFYKPKALGAGASTQQ